MAPRRFQRRRPTMCTVSHREGVGGAHHRADVGVVAEVLDRHMQRVTTPIDVGDDRFPGPVPVGVDDVASIAVAQQDLGHTAGHREGLPARVRRRRPVSPIRWAPVRSSLRPHAGVGAVDRHRRVEQRLVDLALGAQRRVDVHRVQRRVGQDQHRRPVRRAGRVQAPAGQRSATPAASSGRRAWRSRRDTGPRWRRLPTPAACSRCR